MRERGHKESQERGVCWHFECSLARLKHLGVAEHRQVQHGVGNHTWEEEGRMQLQQLGVALSADSVCVAWRKFSSGELVLPLGLKQVLGKRGLRESLPHGRIGAGRRHGQWVTRELEAPW